MWFHGVCLGPPPPPAKKTTGVGTPCSSGDSHKAQNTAHARDARTRAGVSAGGSAWAGMAAEPGPGSAASPGCAGAMERVLPVLLVQLPAEETAQLGARAQLHREQEALGSLTAAGSLRVVSLAPGSRGGSSCCLQGPFGQ